MTKFDEQVVAAIVAHMGDDHADDNLLIARAFGAPEATKSEFVNLDNEAGYWRVTEGDSTRELKIDWPSGPISERPQIREEVVLIFNEACKRLDAAAKPPVKPFSQVLREGSWGDHDDSEGADFMASIMRGTATRDDYVQLVVQHFFMYEALEAVAGEFAEHSDFAPFHDADLVRMESLEADLVYLVGDDWRSKISALPATAAYAERIIEVGREGWIAGIVAHHYTRYLGDLSGGQIISKRVVRQHEFEADKGVEFYNFASLGSLDDFKNRYRAALDALGAALDDDERAKMLDEVRRAYRFNTEVFIDLAHAKKAANNS